MVPLAVNYIWDIENLLQLLLQSPHRGLREGNAHLMWIPPFCNPPFACSENEMYWKISQRGFKQLARKKENCLEFWRACDSEHNERANLYQG